MCYFLLCNVMHIYYDNLVNHFLITKLTFYNSTYRKHVKYALLVYCCKALPNKEGFIKTFCQHNVTQDVIEFQLFLQVWCIPIHNFVMYKIQNKVWCVAHKELNYYEA